MNLRELFREITYTGTLPEAQAEFVTQDSRKVSPGAVFVAIEGRGFDGHDFAARALADGAALAVTRRPLGLEREVTVDDTRATYAQLCQNFFGRPADSLKLIAVTGTNGKTTVSSVLKEVLELQGITCGLIGTIHSQIGDMQIPARFTTPEAWDLNALFSRMVAAGCTHVVMEASSQALAQGRLHGLRFEVGIFTNLTRDHLDYHGDMEQYFEAKKLLFAQSEVMLTNIDDEFGRRLLAECDTPVKKSYSTMDDGADFVAREIALRAGGVRFALLGEGYLCPVRFPMPGEYSVSNALAAAGTAILLGGEPFAVARALGFVRGVRGRCEVVHSDKFTVIRDFAHTADGIEKLLSALRPFVEGSMTVLYGCTGDRDAVKRIPMGEAAVKYGDRIVLTSDNPRTEDPQTIIDSAVAPLRDSGKPYFTEVDREIAIGRALEELKEGDMLVLCGKGHEDYQVLDGVSVYLDERQVVEDWVKAHSHTSHPAPMEDW